MLRTCLWLCDWVQILNFIYY